MNPVSPPSSPQGKTTSSSQTSFTNKPYISSHSSTTTITKTNRLSNSSTIEPLNPYPANSPTVSVVDPRSLGYFQNSPVVRRNSSSVPNLTINTQPEKQLKDPNQHSADFDFSSESSAGSRRTSLVPFKHNQPSNATIKTLRYTPSHKKSFSIHDTTPEPSSLASQSADAITPPTSPVVSKFDTEGRSHTNPFKFPFKSASLPHLASSLNPRKFSYSNSGSSAAQEHPHSNIPRPKAMPDQLSSYQKSSHPEIKESKSTPSQQTNKAPTSSITESTGHHNQPPMNNGNPNNNQNPSTIGQMPAPQPVTGYPFLRALHAFDASSLSSDSQDPEESPASICLSFQESEIVLLHTIHPSGWGDATILSIGVRGWIPTNYFTPYTDPKVTPLLSAVLSFVLNPKSQPLNNGEGSSDPANQTEFSFSQSSITNIVAGVRSLLEACGTLTRDTQTVRRSQSIRKFRKILLAELAILVSLAKQYKNTTDEANIERLVTGSYKIISRAVVFLDIWTIDTSNPGAQTELPHSSFQNGAPSIDNLHSALAPRPDLQTNTSYNSNIETIPEASAGSDEEGSRSVNPIPARTSRANRESVIFHQQPPFARQRLDEVNDALTSYLGNFIHRMTVLETDPTACTQILVNTRKSMLACRELLAAVESISSRSLPRNKDLENCKDKLFGQIRTLVTAARDVVATNPAGDLIKGDDEDPETRSRPNEQGEIGPCSPEGQRLIDIATDCARTSGECVVRCRHILEKIGDFQLATNREYPDFSDGIIAVNKKKTVLVPYGLSGAANPSPSSSTFSPYVSNDESDVTSPVSPLGSFPYGRSTTLLGSVSKGSQDISREPSKGDKQSLLPNIPSLSPLISGGETEYNGNMGSIDSAMGPHSPSDDFDKMRHTTTRIPAVMEEEDEPKDDEGVTVPMTLEPEDQIIIDDNGRVRGGSLDGLVKIMTDETVDQDPTYVSTFFLTFRQFSNPFDLCEALIKRYGSELDETNMDSDDIEALVSRRTKVYGIFKRWMESHWKHSVDIVVLPQIVNFANSQILDIPNAKTVINDLAAKVQQVAEGEPIVPRFINVPGGSSTRMAAVTYSHAPMIGSTVSRHLASQLAKAVEQNESHLAETEVDDDSKSIQSTTNSAWSNSLRMVKASSGPSAPVSILDIEPADIAKQLCLIDSQLFCRIKPEELLDLNFSAKRRHLGIAVNVNEMTLNANQLASFVGDSILTGDVPPKTRRNILKQWIKISEKCHEMRNFNSLMTIISSLQSVNIMRLKKTWELLSPRYHALFAELKVLVSMEKNYASYRALLRKHEIPTIPYLGLYLTDLTFVMEGNNTHRLLVVDSNNKVIPPGRAPATGGARERSSTMVINFDRYERTARIIGEVQNYQVPYRVMASPELQSWIKSEMLKAYTHTSKDHNNLWRRSCIVEPK